MKSRKVILLIALILLPLLGYWGCQQYQAYEARFVRLDDVRYEKTVEELDLSGKPLCDLDTLSQFTNLKKLDLQESGMTLEEYKTIRAMFPDTQILWQIPFQGVFYSMDTERITLTKLAEADLEVLGFFEKLKSVDGTDCPDYPLLHRLRLENPELEVNYTIPAAGENYAYDVEKLVLPGEDASSLEAVLPYFTSLKTLELTAPLAPVEHILALRDAFPAVELSWTLELGGIPVNDRTETLDLTGIPMTVEEMDAALPYLLKLTYVDMTDCGISNEEMDALNQRHENTKIVWTVNLGQWYRTKTDITTFMPLQDNFYPFGNDLENLRYCHDLIAVDIGHRRVTNCSWAAYTPHLKYLIIADTAISDLTPLTGLDELIYLEVFLCPIRDYSPLVTLTALEDLNLSYTRGDPNIIAQITWLKNLWWGYWEDIHLGYDVQQKLRDAIPECNFCFVSKSSTGMGWRSLPNYFAQRDAFGMYYMRG